MVEPNIARTKNSAELEVLAPKKFAVIGTLALVSTQKLGKMIPSIEKPMDPTTPQLHS